MDALQRELFRFSSIVVGNGDGGGGSGAVHGVWWFSGKNFICHRYDAGSLCECIGNDWTSFCYFKNRFMLVILLTPLRIQSEGFHFVSIHFWHAWHDNETTKHWRRLPQCIEQRTTTIWISHWRKKHPGARKTLYGQTQGINVLVCVCVCVIVCISISFAIFVNQSSDSHKIFACVPTSTHFFGIETKTSIQKL